MNGGPGATWSCPSGANTGTGTTACHALRVVQAFSILLLTLAFIDILLSAALTFLSEPADAVQGKYGVLVKGRYSTRTIIKVFAIIVALAAAGFGAGASGVWVIYWNENMVAFSGDGSLHNQTVFNNKNTTLTGTGINVPRTDSAQTPIYPLYSTNLPSMYNSSVTPTTTDLHPDRGLHHRLLVHPRDDGLGHHGRRRARRAVRGRLRHLR